MGVPIACTDLLGGGVVVISVAASRRTPVAIGELQAADTPVMPQTAATIARITVPAVVNSR